MSYEAWIMIFGIALANLFTLTGGLVHIARRLAIIETDIKTLGIHLVMINHLVV